MEETNAGAVALIQPEKLTDWKNPPSLLQLKQDYTDAKSSHDGQVTKIQGWLANLHVTGDAKLPAKKKGNTGSKVQPKLIRKQAEWRYPALSGPFLSTANLFEVKPVSWEDRAAARQNQMVLNNQFNTKIDKVHFFDEYVRTAVEEGTAIIRVGWCYRGEDYEEEVGDFQFIEDPSQAQLMAELDQLQAEAPDQYHADVPEELRQAHAMALERGVPIRPVQVGTKWVTKTRVLANHPTLEICDYRNVVFDPTCGGDFEKANFAVYSFESSRDELLKDGRYKNLDLIEYTGNTILSSPDHTPKDDAGGSFNFADKPRKKIVVHEYWGLWDIDGSGQTKPIVCAWVGNTIIRLEENPFPDKKLPFVVVPYLPVRKSLYGEPDGALLEDNQRITGALTRGMIDLMGKSANSQTGMRRDMLDTTNRRKFEEGKDYEFNGNVDPRQGVYQHTFPEIPASAFNMLMMQSQEAESLTGVRVFSQGVSGDSLGEVAAGIRGALDAASKRELDLLRRLKSGVIKVARKMIAMNQEWLSDEETVRVTNEQFVKVRRDDLGGNFDLDLDISTAEEVAAKAQELAFMLQTLGPDEDPMVRRMILADICRLRKMPDLAQKIENWQPQPDPLQQKKLELEVQLLEAQLRKELAEAQKLQTGAELDQAKVVTEGAKANQLNAAADKTNLDFVEQESGVTQERQKELHGAQAQAQGRLKMIDAAVKQQEIQTKAKTDLLKEYVKAKTKPQPKAA